MRWAKRYKRKDSAAERVLKRIEKRGKAKHERPVKAAGKAAAKSGAGSVLKKAALAPLPELPHEKRFFLADGRSLGSIAELAATLDSLPEEHFRSHVNDSKNDFANWIRGVFGEEGLADAIADIRDRKDCQIALLKHLAVRR